MHYDLATINKDFIYLWCYLYQMHSVLICIFTFNMEITFIPFTLNLE